MIPGLYLKSPPPSPHSAGILLVAADISTDPVLSIRTPSHSLYSAGLVLMPAALSTNPGLSRNPHNPALIIQVFTVYSLRTTYKKNYIIFSMPLLIHIQNVDLFWLNVRFLPIYIILCYKGKHFVTYRHICIPF